MPRLPRVSGREAIRALERLGFVRVGQRGSHVKLVRRAPQGETTCVVPLHGELAPGTLRGVLRQARVTVPDFAGHLSAADTPYRDDQTDRERAARTSRAEARLRSEAPPL
jgi:predicted RNA binding protein YcfA (HicA-like mRNA interferase family)